MGEQKQKITWYKFKATSGGKRLKIEVERLVGYTEVKIQHFLIIVFFPSHIR